MYQQVFDPISDSLGLSAIFGGLPLITLFVLLGGFRVTVWIAGLSALAVALLVSILVYDVPVGQALVVLFWSVVMTLAMCVLVYLQSAAILDWMVVGSK